nr:glycoside hydrolase family 36 N-terminal domain-containing protein [Tessaracoccus coleopterorum]
MGRRALPATGAHDGWTAPSGGPPRPHRPRRRLRAAPGVPGFGHGSGETWAVHTAWSGNHIHQAERDLNGVQVLSGGELLLAGEGRLARGASYRGPWLYFSYGDGLDAVARRYHDFLRALPHAPASTDPSRSMCGGRLLRSRRRPPHRPGGARSPARSRALRAR